MLLLLFLLTLIFPTPSLAKNGLETVKVKEKVWVTASIEENRVTIYGYTSPLSRVELSSTKVFAVTYSDTTGYFLFDKTILPKNPSDLCLSATDDSSRQSTPICIPSPPSTNYHTDIGPILLPPTITIDADNIRPNSTTATSGQSIPNSPIDIYLYQVDQNAPSFPKSVQAFGLPVFSTMSDDLGNYSFNLPTAYATNYRLYSTVKYNEDLSPKSNTLAYNLPSLWWLFLIQNSWLIVTLFIFVITLTYFFYLIYVYYLSKPLNRYLPALFSFPLTTYPTIRRKNSYN
jgi:hypothetical protein